MSIFNGFHFKCPKAWPDLVPSCSITSLYNSIYIYIDLNWPLALWGNIHILNCPWNREPAFQCSAAPRGKDYVDVEGYDITIILMSILLSVERDSPFWHFSRYVYGKMYGWTLPDRHKHTWMPALTQTPKEIHHLRAMFIEHLACFSTSGNFQVIDWWKQGETTCVQI